MKKIIIMALFALSYFASKAQTDSARLELDQIFQYIDKSQIPTGYLNEYGADVVYKKWLRNHSLPCIF